MGTYLVEAFVGTVTNRERRARIDRARSAADDAGIRYLEAIFVPGDETCFYLFAAPSIEAVEGVSDRAGLGADRIVEAG